MKGILAGGKEQLMTVKTKSCMAMRGLGMVKIRVWDGKLKCRDVKTGSCGINIT